MPLGVKNCYAWYKLQNKFFIFFLMTKLSLPSFSLPASDGNTYTQANFSQGRFVFFLYPKDATPGCTLEAQGFRDKMADFAKLGVQIIGVSKDSIASHQRFCNNQSLPYMLLSDPECLLIEGLGSWVQKFMFGKKYMGIERSTFVIENGIVENEWRKVKVKGHVKDVLAWCEGFTADKK